MMDEVTRIALEGSIKKWRNIVEGKSRDQGSRNCPLCGEFVHLDCCGCPIFDKTGQSLCRGTPYDAWGGYTHVFDDVTRALAQAELDFLISLREPVP